MSVLAIISDLDDALTDEPVTYGVTDGLRPAHRLGLGGYPSIEIGKKIRKEADADKRSNSRARTPALFCYLFLLTNHTFLLS